MRSKKEIEDDLKMLNPFGDLTEQELEEMVTFCRELFCDHDKLRPVGNPQSGWRCCNCSKELPLETIKDKHSIEWKWKKGDWFWFDGKIEVYSHQHYPITGGFQTPKPDWVPLPLAHQWLKMFPRDAVLVTDGRCMSMEVTEQHQNLNFSCYRAFRKVEEDIKKEWHLDYCDKCLQMTNHIKERCLKCGDEA